MSENVIGHLSLDFIPDTDTDEQTLTKWLEIIESRCPVNDNLINPTPVKINLKKPVEIAA